MKKSTFVISSKKFSTLDKAIAQMVKWDKDGHLDSKAKVYEVKSIFRVKHKPLPITSKRILKVAHGQVHHLLGKDCAFCKKVKKKILECCFDCGRKYGKKNKQVFGSWIGDCDICGKKEVNCASAPHDYGIYSSKKLEIDDKFQDLI